MCGIAGLLDPRRETSAEALNDLARRMTGPMRHRGPDDDGVWCDPSEGIAFGHRRLSIIDLSVEGHQPMESADERWVLSYNGEIYNFQDLAQRLTAQGAVFRGHSDTEVLTEALARWGVQETLQALNGMFAFAAWDRRERRLWLARDRLGEKPLYYGWIGGTFAFASELKAFHPLPGFEAEVDRDALSLLLRHNYIPAPRSIYRSVQKLRPGHVLHVGPDLAVRDAPYWNATERVLACASDRLPADDAADALEELLADAVSIRMLSDVPLGAFLSGGIDSSTIVALMQQNSPNPVRTFSIGFSEAGYDEAGHAREVARHLGTQHTELYVSPEEAQGVIPQLPAMYDEPFADASQIPTHLVAQLARRHVTVALSGDGGDELFLGYDRYRWARRLDGARRVLPARVRTGAAERAGRVSPERLGRWIRPAARAAGRSTPPEMLGSRAQRGLRLLAAPGLPGLYRRLVSHWQDPDAVVIGATEPDTIVSRPDGWPALHHPLERLAFVDAMSYLPDDILVKVDRATMAVSLEARVPFLDHRVVELAWRMPPEVKIGRSGPKAVLRDVLHRHVPREIVERPKMGFGVPIDTWLRGPLRDWGETLLGERRLRDEGYLRPEPIRQAWQDHLDGRAANHYLLWDVLMFQAWLEAQSRSSDPVGNRISE